MPRIYPLSMKYVSKPWGYELWIYNGDKYCGKKLYIKQGHWLSYHHHVIKDEVLFVETGKIWFTHNENNCLVVSEELGPGHAFHVKQGVKHQMQAIEDTVLFEFSTHHEDSDSIRTTRDLVVDHGDNGFPIRTYQEPMIPARIEIPPMPPMPPIQIPPINIPPPSIQIPPIIFPPPSDVYVSIDSTPSWDKEPLGP